MQIYIYRYIAETHNESWSVRFGFGLWLRVRVRVEGKVKGEGLGLKVTVEDWGEGSWVRGKAIVYEGVLF